MSASRCSGDIADVAKTSPFRRRPSRLRTLARSPGLAREVLEKRIEGGSDAFRVLDTSRPIPGRLSGTAPPRESRRRAQTEQGERRASPRNRRMRAHRLPRRSAGGNAAVGSLPRPSRARRDPLLRPAVALRGRGLATRRQKARRSGLARRSGGAARAPCDHRAVLGHRPLARGWTGRERRAYGKSAPPGRTAARALRVPQRGRPRPPPRDALVLGGRAQSPRRARRRATCWLVPTTAKSVRAACGRVCAAHSIA